MVGPAVVLAGTLWFLGEKWAEYLRYAGLTLMVGMSIWAFVSPANRRCVPDRCELPTQRG